MTDVMLETLTGPQVDEEYWESLMEDSAPMGALVDVACCSRSGIHASGPSFDICSTENVLQGAGNNRAYEGTRDAR